MTWASNHDASIENLRRTQGSLPVRLIMVERSNFQTCSVYETAATIKARNELSFSYFPVVDDQSRILGLYNAERWVEVQAPETPVGDDYLPLSEEVLIGADASILDFLVQADTHPTNLVVSGSRISGLVSLSDIQQLPVRAALFSAITSFEMAMSLLIRSHWHGEEDWIGLLTDGRREKLEEKISKAKSKDTYVSAISLTDFCDKATLVKKSDILEVTGKELKRALGSIERLRNKIAHADCYAVDPQSAQAVCQTLRDLIALKSGMISAFEPHRSNYRPDHGN